MKCTNQNMICSWENAGIKSLSKAFKLQGWITNFWRHIKSIVCRVLLHTTIKWTWHGNSKTFDINYISRKCSIRKCKFVSNTRNIKNISKRCIFNIFEMIILAQVWYLMLLDRTYCIYCQKINNHAFSDKFLRNILFICVLWKKQNYWHPILQLLYYFCIQTTLPPFYICPVINCKQNWRWKRVGFVCKKNWYLKKKQLENSVLYNFISKSMEYVLRRRPKLYSSTHFISKYRYRLAMN